MDNLFLIILVLSLMAIFVFAILSIVQFSKKDSVKGKKQMKKAGFSLAVLIVSFIGFAITTDSESSDTESDKGKQVQTDKKEAQEKTPEVEDKATSELKVKEDVEAEATEKLAKEAEFYTSEVSPKLDAVQAEYDKIWNDLWVTTFDGVSNGNVDVYSAYSNMNLIATRYSLLSQQISDITGDNLSKENKKLLKEYKSKLKSSTTYREMAAEDAAEMFDNRTFKPSEYDSIQSIVGMGDSDMMSAIVSRLSIEENLGLTEKTEK